MVAARPQRRRRSPRQGHGVPAGLCAGAHRPADGRPPRRTAPFGTQQAELNRLYDAYTAKYGLLNSRGNAQAFSDDSSYYLLCSLEILDEDGNLRAQGGYVYQAHHPAPRGRGTMWTRASEALAVSIAEKARVDMEYMEQLTGKTSDELAVRASRA